MPQSPPPRPATGQAARTRVPRRGRTERARAVRPVCLAVVAGCCLGLASANGSAEPLAETQDASPVAPDGVVEAQLEGLQLRFSHSLDERLLANTEHLARQASQHQLALLLADDEPRDRMERRIDARSERELARRANEPRSRRGRVRRVRADRAPLRMESGSLDVERQTLQRAGEERVERRQRFIQPFAEIPRVTVGLRPNPDSDAPLPRVMLRVVSVDETGFDYELRSWGEESGLALTADWVAFASRQDETDASEGLAPASLR